MIQGHTLLKVKQGNILSVKELRALMEIVAERFHSPRKCAAAAEKRKSTRNLHDLCKRFH